MKIAIIGAGPAGLTAGYLLSKAGYQPQIYEANKQVGGLSRSLDLWGYIADLGPHRFFSSDRRVNELWLEVVGNDYQMVDRLTRIFYQDKFFHYPLKPFNALSKLGIIEAGKCIASFASEKIAPTPLNGDFESWVTNRFGKRLYEYFFKSYSEKLWGISCQELDADFAAQRIKKLSLFEAVKNALFQGKQNKHKTLVEQFAYPTGGTGMVYKRMQQAIENNGGTVHLNQPVHRILKDGHTVYGLELVDGSIETFDQVISTMPLSLMVERLPGLPDTIRQQVAQLQFRNTILVYLEIDDTDLFKDNWIYVHSTDLKMGRITNFRNWVPQICPDKNSSLLAVEYWCNFEDEFWTMPDDQLIQLATEEMKQTGLIKDKNVTNGKVLRIPRCYPVYSKGYKNHLRPVEKYLGSLKNLSVIGRYGAFKYNNQDHSILMGILAAENIIKNEQHNLWEVNTDYDNYQEQTVITDTGLILQ